MLLKASVGTLLQIAIARKSHGQTASFLPTVSQELRECFREKDPIAPPRTENQSDLGLVFYRLESHGWRGFQHSAEGITPGFSS